MPTTLLPYLVIAQQGLNFDWTINITSIIALVGGVVALVGAYFGLQRTSDSKFSILTQSIDTKFAQLALQLNTLIEGDVRELRGRVTKVESGQTEWTQTLRSRSHELSDKLNVVLLEIDRLKRPIGPLTAASALAITPSNT